MRDADLRLWLRSKDGADDMHEWWIDPLPSESLFDYARFVREWQWARHGWRLSDRLVTETADVFLEALERRIEELSV